MLFKLGCCLPSQGKSREISVEGIVDASKKLDMQSNALKLWAIGLAMLGACADASAVLGQKATSSKAARTSLNQRSAISKVNAVAPLAMGAVGSAQEVQLESGTVLTEYLTLDGTVFAIRWSGPVLPDLSFFLGSSYSDFKLENDRVRTSGNRSAPVHMRLDSLVVNSSGRMKSFVGHAYVPSLVPLGVSIKDILQ